MNSKTKRITVIGMLCAITYVTMVVGRIPIILFLKYDPSDVIVTLGGFIWGPMTSCIVSVIVATLEMITVSDIGTRPTLDNDSFVSIETHIFDFDKDIYGCTITVNLYKKLREVRKFNELSLLLEQIANDRTMAQEFWGLKQTNHTLHIDVNRHCVILEQQEVYLSTNEFEVLYLLLQSPQTTFTKEQIYEQIWHEPTNNHLHAVENTIFQIRKRLKPYCKGHEYIKTVIGYGYKFNSE